MRRSRGQSEVVGVILLTAVVVVLVTIVGATILSQWQAEAEDTPRVAIESELDATTLALFHQGGDSLDASTVRVQVDGEGGEVVWLDEFSERPADRFHPGSVWRHDDFDGPLSGELLVLVVHDPTNTILHETRHEIE